MDNRAISVDDNKVWMLNVYNYWDTSELNSDPIIQKELLRCKKDYNKGVLEESVIDEWRRADRLVLLDNNLATIARRFRILDELLERFKTTGKFWDSWEDPYYSFVTQQKAAKNGYGTLKWYQEVEDYAIKTGFPSDFFESIDKDQEAYSRMVETIQWITTNGIPNRKPSDPTEKIMLGRLYRLNENYRKYPNVRRRFTSAMKMYLDSNSVYQEYYQSLPSEETQLRNIHAYFSWVVQNGRKPSENKNEKSDPLEVRHGLFRRQMRELRARKRKGKYSNQADAICAHYGYPYEFYYDRDRPSSEVL